MVIKRLGIVVAATLTGASLIFLYGHDPAAHAYYPICVFHALSGLQCPGCGATRALYHLLHGHVATAIRFNLLFVVLSPALAFGTAAESVAIWNNRPTTFVRHRWISWSVALIVIGWGVLRNF